VRGVAALVLAAALAGAGPKESAPPGRFQTLVLRNGCLLRGEVLKEHPDAVVLDLGFTVLTVPVEQILSRQERTEGQGQPASDEDRIYTEGASRSLRERPVKDLARELSESVTLVSTPAGMGSGFVIDERGYVVTNFHVLEGEQEVAVTLFQRGDGGLERVKIDEARIVAINPFCDLALLKIEVPQGLRLRPVVLGSSEDIRDGQSVFAIGNPLGLERTVSEGIISSTRRNFNGQLFIQTTAPINPGNSGGPLFNLRGEVVGVINMKAGFFTEGLSFAIPVDTLKFFLRNRDVFAFDKDNPNTGYHYLPPPAGQRDPGREPE